MAKMRADYIAADTQTVWGVAPVDVDVIRMYRSGSPDGAHTIYRRNETAEAKSAVPGGVSGERII